MKEIIFYLEKVEKTQGNTNKYNLLRDGFQKVKHLRDFFILFYEDNTYNISNKSFEKVFPEINFTKYEDIGAAFFDNKENENVDVSISFEEVEQFLEIFKIKRGNEALVILMKSFADLSASEAKWLSRILLKNLRLGIELKTINKIFDELGFDKIQKFEVQLASKIDDINEWKTFPIMVGTKYDGFRCIVERKGDNITMTSRQGKDVSNFLPELVEYFKTCNFDFIIDGEVMANDFSSISKRIGRKDNFESIDNLHYRVFDIIKYEHIDYTKFEEEKRWGVLRNFFDNDFSVLGNTYFPKSDLFRLEERVVIHTKEELLKIYKKHCDRKEEGIMIKLMGKPYEYGSRKNWFKVKPIFEATMKVVGYELGKGKHKGLVGALLVEDKNAIVKCKVGSGLNDEMREFFTDTISTLNDGTFFIDVVYNEISKNQKDEYSLRFPRFLKIRKDKSEADDLEVKNE